mgnify:CR=1 FL=1
MTIQDWIKTHRLCVHFVTDHLFTIKDVGTFYVLDDKVRIFGEMFNLIVDPREFTEAKASGVDYYVYMFGGKYYYTPIDSVSNPSLTPLKYLGAADQQLQATTHLGVHGSYELLNGSRNYDDWCTKAKFLQYEALGICEKNTLAGTLAFQLSCQRNSIKSILGETVSVDFHDNERLYDVKVFAVNQEGWRNLLRVNKAINIDSVGKHITITELMKRGKGLVLVLTVECPLSENLIQQLDNTFDQLYCQFNPVQYSSPQRDEQSLKAHQKYLNDYAVAPILLSDAYYLDQEDHKIKPMLNKIGSVGSYGSKFEYLKSIDDVCDEISPLFREEDERLFDLFKEAVKNLERVGSDCCFEIDLDILHLPRYEMNKDEATVYKSSDDLFWSIIEERLHTFCPAGDFTIDDYIDRVEMEVEVIRTGGFIDYFLILWDINKWCKTQGILTGIGRGSAGGSLIAYLMGITKLDPLKYGLLFERFLNESRIKNSLPDIDTDFEGARREEVKQYMIDKYGYDYVCSVGTYTTFGLKGVIKDLSRQHDIDFATSNYITTILDVEYGDFKELFVNASSKLRLREFIFKYPEMINLIPLCLGQPKTASIHACATLIVPKVDTDGNPMTIYDWLPVRKTQDGQLISEWEGDYTEAAGFLKEDILGIRQLDKFRAILDLIEQTTGNKLMLEDIPLDDVKVYKQFQDGFSEDVFHFGTEGLIGYAKDVRPDCIEDLIAMIALHRPGAMNSGAHNSYVKRKFQRESFEFDYGLQSVTEDTYGLYVYQEQVMKAVQTLGGLSLVDADGVRKAMGKKIKAKMDSYKRMFLEGALAKGCAQQEAREIWHKLEVFSGYGFNKSHAAAYSITGYICNWLKNNYPMQFWTVAFDYAKEYDIPRYISEIGRSKDGASIRPPNINVSQKHFTADFEGKDLYWSLERIKQCKDAASQAIIEERESPRGKFFDVEDAFDRLPKSKVKKDVFVNLILSGAFDQMYDIDGRHSDRLKILKQYFALRKESLPDKYHTQPEWWWQLQQKLVSGLGYFDYRAIVQSSKCKEHFNKFADATALSCIRDTSRQRRLVAGVVVDVIERNSKNGKFANIVIDCNSEMIPITFWAGEWLKAREEIAGAKNSILLVEGRVQFDDFRYKSNIINTDKNTTYQIL